MIQIDDAALLIVQDTIEYIQDTSTNSLADRDCLNILWDMHNALAEELEII